MSIVHIIVSLVRDIIIRLSPHKLRHSFAKQWLDAVGGLVGLRDQLKLSFSLIIE